MRTFKSFNTLDASLLNFSIGTDRQGKPTIQMSYAHGGELSFLTPPAVTQWPRCTGEGNYGTMWGPADVSKSKFTLDLTDTPINGEANVEFTQLVKLLETIDNKLLKFVTDNQSKILGRRNLSKDEVKMLQIRSTRERVDKLTGETVIVVNLSTPRYQWDGMGGKAEVKVPIVDSWAAPTDADVKPGDVVAATAYASSTYCNVGGDKFGITWAFESVQIVCQRAHLIQTGSIDAFSTNHALAQPIVSEMVV